MAEAWHVAELETTFANLLNAIEEVYRDAVFSITGSFEVDVKAHYKDSLLVELVLHIQPAGQTFYKDYYINRVQLK